jgi:hypothetical protein
MSNSLLLKIRMLDDSVHPEKIPESNQRFIIKIVKQGHVFGPVDDLLMDKTADVLYLASAGLSNIAHNYKSCAFTRTF